MSNKLLNNLLNMYKQAQVAKKANEKEYAVRGTGYLSKLPHYYITKTKEEALKLMELMKECEKLWLGLGTKDEAADFWNKKINREIKYETISPYQGNFKSDEIQNRIKNLEIVNTDTIKVNGGHSKKLSKKAEKYPAYIVEVGKKGMGLIYDDDQTYEFEDKEEAIAFYNKLKKEIKPNQYVVMSKWIENTGDYAYEIILDSQDEEITSSKKIKLSKKAWTETEKKQVGALEDNETGKYNIYQTDGGEFVLTNHKLDSKKYALMDTADTFENLMKKYEKNWEEHDNFQIIDKQLLSEYEKYKGIDINDWLEDDSEEEYENYHFFDLTKDYVEETKEAAKRDYTAQLNQVKDIMKEYGYGLTDNGYIYLLKKEEPKDEGFQVKFKGDRLRVELDGKLRYSGYGPQAIEDFLVGAFYAKKQSSKTKVMRKRAFRKLALKRAMHKKAGEFEEMMKLKSTDPKLISYLAKEFGIEESTVSQYTDVSENAEELYNILDEQANKYGYEWDKFEYDEYGDRIDEDDFRGDTDDLEKAVEYLKNNINKALFKFEYVGEFEDNYLTFSVNEKLIPTEKPVIHITNYNNNYDISFFAESQKAKEEDQAEGIGSEDRLTILIRRTSDEILNEIVNYVNIELPKKIAEQNKKQSSKNKAMTKKAYKNLKDINNANLKYEDDLAISNDMSYGSDAYDQFDVYQDIKTGKYYVVDDEGNILVERDNTKDIINLTYEDMLKELRYCRLTKRQEEYEKNWKRNATKTNKLPRQATRKQAEMLKSDFLSEQHAQYSIEKLEEQAKELAKQPGGTKKRLEIKQKIEEIKRLFPNLNKQATIKHENGVYNVYSESGKCLGKGYKTKEEAQKRLKQVEYFKHKKSFRDVVISKMAKNNW